jgi:hypothetical protein
MKKKVSSKNQGRVAVYVIVVSFAVIGALSIFLASKLTPPSPLLPVAESPSKTTTPQRITVTKPQIRDKSILSYFQYVASDWRQVQRSSSNKIQNLRQYRYSRSVSSTHGQIRIAIAPQATDDSLPTDNFINNVSANSEELSDVTSTPADQLTPSAAPIIPSELITADQWQQEAPREKMYLDADWYCSSLSFKLYLQAMPTSTRPYFGQFHGDCTNPEVIVSGIFTPQKLQPLSQETIPVFDFDTHYYRGGDYFLNSAQPDVCDIQYYRDAGQKGVYAIQYTCDDGINAGVRDDIQFTVYAFPNDWLEEAQIDSLLKEFDQDSDGDRLSNQRERDLGTDPYKADTDNDGTPDGHEVEQNTDPLSPASKIPNSIEPPVEFPTDFID